VTVWVTGGSGVGLAADASGHPADREAK
jgi:hypothetical protein